MFSMQRVELSIQLDINVQHVHYYNHKSVSCITLLLQGTSEVTNT